MKKGNTALTQHELLSLCSASVLSSLPSLYSISQHSGIDSVSSMLLWEKLQLIFIVNYSSSSYLKLSYFLRRISLSWFTSSPKFQLSFKLSARLYLFSKAGLKFLGCCCSVSLILKTNWNYYYWRFRTIRPWGYNDSHNLSTLIWFIVRRIEFYSRFGN